MKTSLLDDDLFSIQTEEGSIHHVSLPTLLDKLYKGDDVSFQRLQPHQIQPWYSFLVQVASMSIGRDVAKQPPQDGEEWKRMLLNLSGGEQTESAWNLVEPDAQKPAFMQSPIPEDSLEKAGYLNYPVDTPDDLDMLVTSKNHDLKMNRLRTPRIEDWIYALVTLQTMEGFMGRGNYGVVRMNGGFSSRPQFGYAKTLDLSTRFKRDLDLLVQKRNTLTNYKLDGIPLLWTVPWDGKRTSQVNLYDCDPQFIEVCRRVRFTTMGDQLLCYRVSTNASRIAAPEDLNGMTDDPWTPIDVENSKALSVSNAGLTFKLLQQILFKDTYQKPISMTLHRDEVDGAYLIATVLARKQGGTEGFHQRTIPIPGRVTRLFASKGDAFQKLGRISAGRVDLTAELLKRCLRPALNALFHRGNSQDTSGSPIAAWISRYEDEVDRVFFDKLWTSADTTEEDARIEWEQFLKNLAESILKDAESTLPESSFFRWKAITTARAILYGKFRDLLPTTVKSNDPAELSEADSELSAS